jgi:DNA-binding winged helix-turn-helix (wHTH) protein/tetratricopeptide (TPR) repeat protein
VRFGPFEVDLSSRELRKHGVRLKLSDQPFEVLTILIARPGRLIAREEIRQKLWPGGTFVDFENGLNSAVNRLRDALGDSADTPKFIETVPRHGYRFIASVERIYARIAAVAEPKSELAPIVRQPRRWLWLTGATVAAVLALTAFQGWRLYRSPKQVLNFGERDWVLVSNFENRTGNPLLDGTLEYALERELSNSQFVNVVPRERAGDALRLMHRPGDTKIDAALGREICLRDGGIRALLTGRVEKLGTTYVMSAELVDPANGVTVASLTEEDAADSQMAAAIRRLSGDVRETLGEKMTLIQQSEANLEKVTTPSLHALQLYSQANELMRTGSNQQAAAVLLKQAIAEDREFASAHLLLAYTYENTGKVEEAQSEFRRASELADATSDRERFFILGSYYDVVEKDGSKAIENYEALLHLHPDHYWANSNLMDLYFASQRIEDAARLCVHFADVRPGDLWINEMAVWATAIVRQDWTAAQPYIQRASALVAAQGKSAAPNLAAWIGWFPGYEQWLQGNVAQAHADLLQFERTAQVKDADSMGTFFLTFGELAKAEKYFQDAPEPSDGTSDREQDLAFVAFVRGDWEDVKKHLGRTRHIDPRSTAAVLMARAGYFARVEESLRDPDPPPSAINLVILRGELALARGDTAQAVRFFEDVLSRRPTPFGGGVIFFCYESLAKIYRKQGRLDDALHLLQQASARKPRTYSNPIGSSGTFAWNWMRTELQLADVYREMGRVSEAEKVEAELSNLLTYADPDHPMLRELRER